MSAEEVCAKCAVSLERGALAKCPMCFKMVCEECRYQVSGRTFCSAPCANFFFFEGDEDEET